MADTTDDLSAPLGQKTARAKRRLRLPFSVIQAFSVALGLFLAAFAGFAIFNDNPLGGEPIARVALRSQPAEERAVAASYGSEHVAKVPGNPGSRYQRAGNIIRGVRGECQV